MRHKRSTMPMLYDHLNHHRDTGDRVLSYDTCILERCKGLTIGNVTYYSQSTLRHQQKVNAFTADVVLSDVPQGTKGLLLVAAERGLVETGLITISAEHGMTTPFIRKVQHANPN